MLALVDSMVLDLGVVCLLQCTAVDDAVENATQKGGISHNLRQKDKNSFPDVLYDP